MSDNPRVNDEMLMTSAYCPIPDGPKPRAISAAVIAPVSKPAIPGKADTITSSIALRESKMTFLGSAIADLNDRIIWQLWFAHKFVNEARAIYDGVQSYMGFHPQEADKISCSKPYRGSGEYRANSRAPQIDKTRLV
jgi:hypothetical protein